MLVPIVTLRNDPNPVTNEVREDGKETRIAWWVSDEGQKASLNAVAPKNYITIFKDIDYRIQSLPFYSGINGLTVPVSGSAGIKAFEINNDEESADPNSVATLRYLTDVKQIDILKSGNVPVTTQLSKLFFHGVTFNTKGLLVNVREGGFKKTCHLALPASTMLMKRKIRAMKSTTTPPNTSPVPTEQQGTNIKPLRTRSCGTT